MVRNQTFCVAVVVLLLAAHSQLLAGQTLRVGTPEFSFGLLDGPDDYVIGQVGDVAVAVSGDIYFTDPQLERVWWLHADGTLGGWFGQEGDGPEEFRWASRSPVAILPDGRIAVGDAGHRRIVFLRHGEEGLEFDGDLRINGYPRDLCVLGGDLYVFSLQDGYVIHRLDQDGNVVLSFGAPVSTPFDLSERWTSMADGYSASGQLFCSEESDMVVALPYILPEVRAFDPAGRLLWARELSPYFRTTPTQTARGSVAMFPDPRSGTTHLGVGVWEWNGLLGIQLLEADLSGAEPRSEVRFLDMATGQELARQEGVPRVASVDGSFIVTWENAPFPRIVKLRGGVTR